LAGFDPGTAGGPPRRRALRWAGKRYELIQAQRQAEIVAAQAKGKGDAALAEAKGVAETLRVKGEAEAAYNSKVAGSLTPVLIQQQYLARWDGRLAQYNWAAASAP
jgi:regulator of protease activity HflC (stomatin/prohibitin superfamily)